MKRLDFLTVCTACAVVGLVAGHAFGQYYTPLRYDLRYTSPTYIPSGTLRFGPRARYDPYKFGHYNPGNLSVTGNLRLGKSFQGTSPYRSTGSQLSLDLPSTRLSNFRRDSISLQDIGTGLEYGGLGAFYPGSASVTTPYSAGTRFAVPLPGPRAPYVPRNVNTSPPLPPAGGGVFTPSHVATGTVPTVERPMTAGGLAIPPSMLDYANALLDGRASPLPADVTEPPEPTQVEDRFKSSYEKFGHKFESVPTNIFIPDDRPGARAGDMTMPDEPSTLFWLDQDMAGAQAAWMPQQQAQGTPAPAKAQQDSPGAEAIWFEQDAEPEPAVLAAPESPMPVSTYAVYVVRGHAAMKESAYGKAEALYAAGVALDPDRPAAFFGRIHALLAGRMYLQVIVVLERELTRHPQWVKVAPNLKALYARPGVYDRIVGELQSELEIRPDDAGYNFLIGYVYYTAREKAKARSHLEKAARARSGKTGPEKTVLAAIEGG